MNTRKTQRDRILHLLIEARGEWVPLPQILDLKISQFGARIKELRGLGFSIENRTNAVNGIKHSWYRLHPNGATQQIARAKPEHPSPTLLFAKMAMSAPEPASYLDFETGRRGGR